MNILLTYVIELSKQLFHEKIAILSILFMMTIDWRLLSSSFYLKKLAFNFK